MTSTSSRLLVLKKPQDLAGKTIGEFGMYEHDAGIWERCVAPTTNRLAFSRSCIRWWSERTWSTISPICRKRSIRHLLAPSKWRSNASVAASWSRTFRPRFPGSLPCSRRIAGSSRKIGGPMALRPTAGNSTLSPVTLSNRAFFEAHAHNGPGIKRPPEGQANPFVGWRRAAVPCALKTRLTCEELFASELLNT